MSGIIVCDHTVAANQPAPDRKQAAEGLYQACMAEMHNMQKAVEQMESMTAPQK